MNKIKIAHVLHSVGGVDIYLRLISENTNPKEISHIIIHQFDVSKKAYLNNDKKIKEYYIPIKREINIIGDLMSIYKTIKYLRIERPNVIHAHSAKGGVIARIASLFYRVNVLYTPHAFSYLSANSKLKRLLFLKTEQFFKHFNSTILSTSQSEKKRAINDVHFKKSKAIIFNNSVLPIDVNNLDYSILNELKLPNEYICTVGRPSYQKNIEFMVDVVYKLKEITPDIHLVIMGVGEYSPNLETVKEKIKILKLSSNITLVNWIDRTNIFSIINKSSLYISTSRYEGLPYSVIESLALSKACVVTNCDGNIDLIKNDFNGYVIEQGELEEFCKMTYKVLKNENLRKRFEEKSLSFFEDNFNLKKNIYLLEEIYKKYAKTN
tara:strand:- start:228 stop:1367 length:1140 start_codon:yes stop_codon:yes gene_type:complete